MPSDSRATGPPDFVGVGAQRAGTTWWFRTLYRHPKIAPPRKRQKELHFFDLNVTRELTQADIDAYHHLFPRRPGQIVGEWTPIYMSAWWVPPLIKRAAPDAKLLVMLRDPIERYRSGIQHHRTRSPEKRLHTIAADAIERGRYATQLERLWRVFDPERVLVLQYERCRANPQEEWDRTLSFLGVESMPVPQPDQARGSTMAARKTEVFTDMDATLHRVLDREVERLQDLTDAIDVSLWPNFAELARA